MGGLKIRVAQRFLTLNPSISFFPKRSPSKTGLDGKMGRSRFFRKKSEKSEVFRKVTK